VRCFPCAWCCAQAAKAESDLEATRAENASLITKLHGAEVWRCMLVDFFDLLDCFRIAARILFKSPKELRMMLTQLMNKICTIGFIFGLRELALALNFGAKTTPQWFLAVPDFVTLAVGEYSSVAGRCTQ